MELKRQLTALGKRMSPQIEVMNVNTEIRHSIKRIDELITYAQTKIDRTAERKANKEGTIGAAAQKAREAADKLVEDEQNREADDNLKDQEEAFDARNKEHRDRTGTVMDDLPDMSELPLAEPTPAIDLATDDEGSPVVDPNAG